MRRRARPLLVAFGLLLVTACSETSRVDPDAIVTVAGQVHAADGTALTDRPVRLATGVGAGDAAFAIFTLGLACTADVCGDDVRTTTTDAEGRYQIEVEGRDTQTSFGGVRPQLVSAVAAPRVNEVSGGSITASFVVQTTQVDLSTLRVVDPMLTLRSSASSVDAAWKAAAAAPYTLTFEQAGITSVPVWELASGQASAGVDERVLEDTRGRAILFGRSTDTIEAATSRSLGVQQGSATPQAPGRRPHAGAPARTQAAAPTRRAT